MKKSLLKKMTDKELLSTLASVNQLGLIEAKILIYEELIFRLTN